MNDDILQAHAWKLEVYDYAVGGGVKIIQGLPVDDLGQCFFICVIEIIVENESWIDTLFLI
jgi:hypothetical protein